MSFVSRCDQRVFGNDVSGSISELLPQICEVHESHESKL